MSLPAPHPDFLLAHLQYDAWAVARTLALLDKLPPDEIAKPVVSSFPSILATLQHLYQCDRFYFRFIQGAAPDSSDGVAPTAYADLKAAFPELHAAMLAWARDHVPDVARDEGPWPVWRVIVHMVNHTTHHLGQIVTLVRQAGYTPEQADWTDISLFYLHMGAG
jgi:uncharacterized damage-inducible protein DinB